MTTVRLHIIYIMLIAFTCWSGFLPIILIQFKATYAVFLRVSYLPCCQDTAPAPGRAVWRWAVDLHCLSAEMPRWSYGEPLRIEQTSAARRMNSPLSVWAKGKEKDAQSGYCLFQHTGYTEQQGGDSHISCHAFTWTQLHPWLKSEHISLPFLYQPVH